MANAKLVRAAYELRDRTVGGVSTNDARYWSAAEHDEFVRIVQEIPLRDARTISKILKTKTAAQVRTHRNKWLEKLGLADIFRWQPYSCTLKDLSQLLPEIQSLDNDLQKRRTSQDYETLSKSAFARRDFLCFEQAEEDWFCTKSRENADERFSKTDLECIAFMQRAVERELQHTPSRNTTVSSRHKTKPPKRKSKRKSGFAISRNWLRCTETQSDILAALMETPSSTELDSVARETHDTDQTPPVAGMMDCLLPESPFLNTCVEPLELEAFGCGDHHLVPTSPLSTSFSASCIQSKCEEDDLMEAFSTKSLAPLSICEWDVPCNQTNASPTCWFSNTDGKY